jgi:hypothetical protein
MKDQIVEKLRDAVSAPVHRECEVVYILTLARKLLEKYPPVVPPFALKLYCHWALHVDLTGPGTTLPLLERVDRFAESVLIAGRTDFVEEDRMFEEFLFLKTFRAQLRQLLKAYDLPVDICDQENRWHDFVKIYAGIIEDGSLSCRARRNSLKLIGSVTFSKGKSPRKDALLPFTLTWTVALLTGNKLKVEVNAAPSPQGERILMRRISVTPYPK